MLGTIVGFLVSLVVYFLVHVIIFIGLALALIYGAVARVLRLLKLILRSFTLPFRREAGPEPP